MRDRSVNRESPLQVSLGDARTEAGRPCWTGISGVPGDDENEGDEGNDDDDGDSGCKEKQEEERGKHKMLDFM